MSKYRCFTRTWWKPNPAWPDGREPSIGKSTTRAYFDTSEEAREYAQAWNKEHKPGPMSLKCEWEEV